MGDCAAAADLSAESKSRLFRTLGLMLVRAPPGSAITQAAGAGIAQLAAVCDQPVRGP